MNLKLLLLVGLAFVAGLISFKVFLSGHPSTSTGNISLYNAQPDCDLNHTPCQAKGKDGHIIQLSLSPQPLPLLQDIQVRVAVPASDVIRTAQISIEGVSMFMGMQIIQLSVQEDGRLTGKMQLPVCSSREMKWQATLNVQMDNGGYRAVFPFTTIAP